MDHAVILHAGLIACRAAGFWRGVLITGPSGSGKSDLALRMLEAGYRLVADDRTVVWTSAGKLYGKAAPALHGLIEARGLGVVAETAIAFTAIALICDCTPHDMERAPENAAERVLDIALPRIRLAALEPSAPAKLNRALMHLGDGH
jgi:serine kinase of HPr protein (carbohydrate metabolism regulator)